MLSKSIMAEVNSITLKRIACDTIDSHSDELREINKKLLENPELSFGEKLAHEILTDYLETRDFEVSRNAYGMETAFRASSGGKQGPCIGVICEYDALPEVGHACGHNLIAESGVAAGLGIKAALKATENKLGKVVVLGTPAEEDGGGKVVMIDKGCFKDINYCMMVHPTPVDSTVPLVLANGKVKAIFKGHSSHAAAFPWEGLNALDAAVAAYNSISMLRQQMKPTWRVHGVFKEGGVKTNIIPDRAALQYACRAPSVKEVDYLKQKLISCFEGAALSTGCTVDFDCKGISYSNMDSNPTMARLYQTNAESLGVQFPPLSEQKEKVLGSTDMGNVSHVVPSIHPLYSIGSTAVNHSYAFTAAAGTDIAHNKTLLASKALAMTAIDLYCNEELRKQVQDEFAKIKHQ